MFKCKKCGSKKFKLEPKGAATGLYCASCLSWHKWVSKSKLPRYQGLLKKGPTAAEKLLWLAENTSSLRVERHTAYGEEVALGDIAQFRGDNLEAAIEMAYKWQRGQK